MALTQISTDGIKNGTITGSDLATNIDLVDNQRLRLGTGNDLEIFHNNDNSFINDSGTGQLMIQASGLRLRNYPEGHTQINCQDDVVELYYNNTKRLETDASGVKLSNGRFYSAGTFAFIESSDTSTATLTLKKSASGADSIDYLQCRDSSNNIKLVISGSGDIDIEDNSKLKLGTSDDLQIYHDGNHSRVDHTGTGDLIFRSDVFRLRSPNDEDMIIANENGNVELYYDNSKKFETTNTGGHFTGKFTFNDGSSNQIAFGTSEDLQIYHDGNHSYIEDAGTGNLIIKSNVFRLRSTGDEEMIIANENGNVKLYHNNVKKLETTSTGVTVTGQIISDGLQMGDSDIAKFGSHDDLQIYHDGSHSYIDESSGTGRLKVRTGGMDITSEAGAETIATFNMNGAVELYHDNSKKFETTSDGVKISGAEGVEAILSFEPDEGDNASDKFRFRASDSAGFFLENGSSNETSIKANFNGSVELYHDNSKKFETTSVGASIPDSGNQTASSAHTTGALFCNLIRPVTANNNSYTGTYFMNRNAVGEGIKAVGIVETGLRVGNFTSDLSATEKIKLTYDGNIEMKTDSGRLKIGASEDLQIYHDGNHSRISDQGTGFLVLETSQLQVNNAAGNEAMIVAVQNGAVELYHDNSKKFETNSSGVKVFGQLVQERSSARAIALNRLGSAGQMILFDFQGTKCGEILVDTNSTSYITNGSDKSLKKNFQSWSENVLNLFKNINPQEFHFNNQQDTDKKHKGYIAQDMVDSFPEAYPKDDEGKYAFNPSGMVVYLMKAIQELEAEVAALKAA
jgi:CDGSH-type Zn-finger protein